MLFDFLYVSILEMDKRAFLSLLATFVVIQQVHCKKVAEDESIFSMHSSYTLPLEHSFGTDDKFSARGNIIFKTSKSTTASFTHEIELSDQEVDKLRNLGQEDGLYFIRSPIRIGGSLTDDESNNGTSYVSTFVKACYLYGSGLQESITVAIDYSGNVIGLSIVSPRSDCQTEFESQDATHVFNSTVLVQQQVRSYSILFYVVCFGDKLVGLMLTSPSLSLSLSMA